MATPHGGTTEPGDRAPAATAGRADHRGRRRRSAPALLLVAGSVLGLAACGSSSSSTTTTTTATTTTTTAGSSTTSTTSATTTTGSGPRTAGCATASLAITFGSPNGTAGAIHYGITFHNTGSSSCTLYGYPGVSFLEAGGGQIGAPAQRQGSLSPSTVTLAVGGNAYSSVAVTDPGIPPCSSSATATQVRIYPPGETHPALVAASGVSVCSSPNTPSYSSAIVAPVTASPV